MHELSLAQGLVGQLENAARAEQAVRVVRVVVAIGPYAGADAEALVRANPYRLAGAVSGIGFTIADRIARFVVEHS